MCIEATEKFLAFSAAVGNPLHQPIPEYHFPGVKPGDCWCLCASRYAQALQAEKAGMVQDASGDPVTGFVPKIYLRATHEKTLQYVPLEILMEYAIDADEAKGEQKRLDDLRSALEKTIATETGEVGEADTE